MYGNNDPLFPIPAKLKFKIMKLYFHNNNHTIYLCSVSYLTTRAKASILKGISLLWDITLFATHEGIFILCLV